MEAIASPTALRNYIAACPQATHIFANFEKRTLLSVLTKALSTTAIQTGLKIGLLVLSNNTLSCQILGQLVSRVTVRTASALDIGSLRFLFNLCLYHEPLVQRCTERKWLVKREYNYDNRLDPLIPRTSGTEPLLWRLERPNEGGYPLAARLFSGFFSLQLFLQLGSIVITEYLEPALNLVPSQLAELYNLPSIQRPQHAPADQEVNWCNADLTVDWALVDRHLQRHLIDDDPHDFSGHGQEVIYDQQGQAAERQLLEHMIYSTTHHLPCSWGALGLPYIWANEDMVMTGSINADVDVIDIVARVWRQMLPTPFPTPFTWEYGHVKPLSKDPEVAQSQAQVLTANATWSLY